MVTKDGAIATVRPVRVAERRRWPPVVMSLLACAQFQWLCDTCSWIGDQLKRIPKRCRCPTFLLVSCIVCAVCFLGVFFAIYYPLLSMNWTYFQSCVVSNSTLVTGYVLQYVVMGRAVVSPVCPRALCPRAA